MYEEKLLRMDRRTFLKIAGIGSVAITAGCSSEIDKTLFSLVHVPDDMITGKAVWYATTCRECPAGCGIIAKNREGRIIKRLFPKAKLIGGILPFSGMVSGGIPFVACFDQGLGFGFFFFLVLFVR